MTTVINKNDCNGDMYGCKNCYECDADCDGSMYCDNEMYCEECYGNILSGSIPLYCDECSKRKWLMEDKSIRETCDCMEVKKCEGCRGELDEDIYNGRCNVCGCGGCDGELREEDGLCEKCDEDEILLNEAVANDNVCHSCNENPAVYYNGTCVECADCCEKCGNILKKGECDKGWIKCDHEGIFCPYCSPTNSCNDYGDCGCECNLCCEEATCPCGNVVEEKSESGKWWEYCNECYEKDQEE